MSTEVRFESDPSGIAFRQSSPAGAIRRSDSGGVAGKRLQVKAGSGLLFTVQANNSNGSTRYLQLFDSLDAPANGEVPLQTTPIATTATGSLDFGTLGLPFNEGMWIALSSTEATLTLAAANDGIFTATFT